MFFFFFFFFDDIKQLIESSLSEGEAIETVVDDKEDAEFDLFLPGGCKKLGFPQKTALQLKRRLAPGDVSMSVQNAISLVVQNRIEQFVVLYEESDAASLYYKIPQVLYNKFVFLSWAELKSRAGNLAISSPKDWKQEREERLDTLRNELRYAPNTLMVGAGLSCSLGCDDWKSLLDDLAKRLKFETSVYEDIAADSDHNNLLFARYLKSIAKAKKKRMVTNLRPILYKNGISSSSPFLDAVVALIKNKLFKEVITYNFDNYLEAALTANGIQNKSLDCQSRSIKNYLPVLHVHGMIHPTDKTYDKNVVLSEDEYHDLYRDSYHWANVAQLYALTHTTCVFVGLSMKDPSLRRLLDIASKQGSGNIEHYAFLRRDEYNNHREAEEIFSQMGVGIIWCESKEDIAVQIEKLS